MPAEGFVPIDAAPARPNSPSRPGSASRPSSAASDPSAGTDSKRSAQKLAKIAVLLRNQGETKEAILHFQRSLRLDPGNSGVWKTLGACLSAQGGSNATRAAAATFGAAVNLTLAMNDAPAAARDAASGAQHDIDAEGATTRFDDLAARTGLATCLAQLEQPAAAVDELLHVIRTAGETSATASALVEPLDRLKRRIMPAPRFSAAQDPARFHAWHRALVSAFSISQPNGSARILDCSTTVPLPSLIAAASRAAKNPIVRVEPLPTSVAKQLFEANDVRIEEWSNTATAKTSAARSEAPLAVDAVSPRTDGEETPPPGSKRRSKSQHDLDAASGQRSTVRLVSTSTRDGEHRLPSHADGWSLIDGEKPNVLLIDTDTSDLFGSAFFERVQEGRRLIEGGHVLPEEVLIHVAVVESRELLRLNAVVESVGGVDLGGLNRFSHRTRTIQLSDIPHRLLTKPIVAAQIRLDGASPVAFDGEATIDLPILHDGEAHALVVWHSLMLTKSRWVTTAPDLAGFHTGPPAAEGLDGGTDVESFAGRLAQRENASSDEQGPEQAAEMAADDAASMGRPGASARQVAYYLWTPREQPPSDGSGGGGDGDGDPDGSGEIGAVRVAAKSSVTLNVRWRANALDFDLVGVRVTVPSTFIPISSHAVPSTSTQSEPPPNRLVSSGEAASGPRTRVVLARSGPDPARVSHQNFGSSEHGHARAKLLSEYHFAMLNDRGRTRAFAGAIARAVGRLQPSLVLDVGCGTGVLAILAARAGAPRVLALEMTPRVAHLAREIVAAHGLADKVDVVASHSSQVAPPDGRRADMLVFEVLGTDPLCEGILPSLKDAHERLLAPGAAVLPCELIVHAVLVESLELLQLNRAVASEDAISAVVTATIDRAAEEEGKGTSALGEPSDGGEGGETRHNQRSAAARLNLSALNNLSHRTRAIRLDELVHTRLTKPSAALRLTLDGEAPPPLSGEADVELHVDDAAINGGGRGAEEEGGGGARRVDAIVCWFTAVLDRSGSSGSAISTAPTEGGTMRGHSWGQCAHLLPHAQAGMTAKSGGVFQLRTHWSSSGISFTLRSDDQPPTAAFMSRDAFSGAPVSGLRQPGPATRGEGAEANRAFLLARK